jgi:hypothetical protein
MANPSKPKFLEQLRARFGEVKKLAGSLSLYEIGGGEVRIYTRYSKRHARKQGFYGLRKADLDRLEGVSGFVVFLWDEQEMPLIIPTGHLVPLLEGAGLASDGQYKAGVFITDSSTELYFAGVGRFSVDGFYGWSALDAALAGRGKKAAPQLNHFQWQTIVGSIGARKGFDIWVPANNRSRLDWNIAERFPLLGRTPPGFASISNVIDEIDVIWVHRGEQGPAALFEIEHSTSIYSGLLRFNDVHLLSPKLKPRYHIIADSDRRSEFVRLVNRPTFQVSRLADVCSFLDYQQVSLWHEKTNQS